MCSLFLGRHLSQPLLLPICIGMRAVSVVSVATMESMLASCKGQLFTRTKYGHWSGLTMMLASLRTCREDPVPSPTRSGASCAGESSSTPHD